jgi:hypothetical protein
MIKMIVFDGSDEELINRAIDKCHQVIDNDDTFLNVDLRDYSESEY